MIVIRRRRFGICCSGFDLQNAADTTSRKSGEIRNGKRYRIVEASLDDHPDMMTPGKYAASYTLTKLDFDCQQVSALVKTCSISTDSLRIKQIARELCSTIHPAAPDGPSRDIVRTPHLAQAALRTKPAPCPARRSALHPRPKRSKRSPCVCHAISCPCSRKTPRRRRSSATG